MIVLLFLCCYIDGRIVNILNALINGIGTIEMIVSVHPKVEAFLTFILDVYQRPMEQPDSRPYNRLLRLIDFYRQYYLIRKADRIYHIASSVLPPLCYGFLPNETISP